MAYITDTQVDCACETLRKAIEAAKNSNHAGEVFVIAASNAPGLVEAAKRILHDIDDLMANSQGVIGLHLNGDIATWDELDEGGRFSPWLGQGIHHLRAAISLATGDTLNA